MTRVVGLLAWIGIVAGVGAAAAGDDIDKLRSKGGDNRKIEFVRPFEKALARAKAENRLVFLKPVYGGVDAEGERDYRCGSW